MDHRTIVSFFTCQLVWVNRYRAPRQRSIASRTVVLPLSPGPIRQLRPGEGCQLSKRTVRKFWISTLQILTTVQLLGYHFPHLRYDLKRQIRRGYTAQKYTTPSIDTDLNMNTYLTVLSVRFLIHIPKRWPILGTRFQPFVNFLGH